MRTTKYPDTNIIWTCFDKGSGLGANVRIFTQMPKCVIFEPLSHFWSSTISRLNAGKIIHKDTKLFKKNCLRHKEFQEGWHQKRGICSTEVSKESDLQTSSRTKILHFGS